MPLWKGSSWPRGSDRRWRKVRGAAHLAREPLCRLCLAGKRVVAATGVDHIVPLAKGGAKYDPENLQSLCTDGKTGMSRLSRMTQTII
jgi:5-methylcytosine-specific restriction enzyme A